MRHANILVKVLKDVVGNPSLGVEIGIWKGETSHCLLKSFPSLRLWMVDRYLPFSDEQPGKVANQTQAEMYESLNTALEATKFASDRRIMIVGDSIKSSELVRDGSLDFVFIDGCHTYEAVKKDVLCWSKKVRSGGLLSGHDYVRLRNRGSGGVKKSVDEYALENDKKIKVKFRVWWTKV